MSRDAERRARLDAAMGGGQPAGAASARSAAPSGAAPADGRAAVAAPGSRTAAGPTHPPARGAPRGPMALVADRRGLTAVGIALVDLVGGFVGLAWDLTHGSHILGGATAVTFAVAAIAAALLAHREDLAASVIIPPLAYATVVLVAAIDTGSGGSGTFVHNVAEEAVVHVLTSAPGLLVAVAGAAVVAIVRFFAGRAAANRRRAAARASQARVG